jgi:hypothetical protein
MRRIHAEYGRTLARPTTKREFPQEPSYRPLEGNSQAAAGGRTRNADGGGAD